MTENGLAIREVQLNTWQTITAIAPTMHQSRLFGVTSEAAAAAIMLKGYELGLGLAASFEFIHIIQNKPTLSPRGALAVAMRSGELEGMKVEEKKDSKGAPVSCYVWMKRRGGMEYSAEFSMADAERAGLTGRDGSAWKTYPQYMLKWRAMGAVLDVLLPDVIGGLKRADEYGVAVDASGNVVEGDWLPEAEPPAPTLEWLVQEYGPERVMEVAGGKIPATEEEVAAAAMALAA